MWRATGSTSTIPITSVATTLLTFYLPLEQIQTMTELLHIRDKARGLREYLDAKKQGDKGADEISLSQILREIDQQQRKIVRYQKISSYFTLPLSLVPLPIVGPFLEKAVSDVIEWGIEKKLLEKYKWHFSLLDYSDNRYDRRALPQPTLQTFLSENYKRVLKSFINVRDLQRKAKGAETKLLQGVNTAESTVVT